MFQHRDLTTRKEAERPERIERQRLAIAPPVDVYENEDEVLLVADVPGVREDGLGIHLDKSELRLEAKRTDAPDLEYRRTFVLPSAVDPDRVSAELRGGQLTVHLPKRESLKPRQIAVKSA